MRSKRGVSTQRHEKPEIGRGERQADMPSRILLAKNPPGCYKPGQLFIPIHPMRTIASFVRLGFVILAVMWLGVGSGPLAAGSIFDHMNYQMDLTDNVSGQRTITRRTEDGVKRRLETGKKIDLADGTVTKFEPGALIKLQQEGGPEARQAELREKAGKLELWIKDDQGFHPGGEADQAWLKKFLTELMKSGGNDLSPGPSASPRP